jgi:hypothetical protein
MRRPFQPLAILLTASLARSALAVPCIDQRTQLTNRAEAVAGLERAMSELQTQLDTARREMVESQRELTHCEGEHASTPSSTIMLPASSDSPGAMDPKRSVKAKRVESKPPSPPLRRAAENEGDPAHDQLYAVHCYGANSSNTDPSCNCLGLPMDEEFAKRPTIRVIVGEWTAGAIDAFLLKIVIEEYMGYPVELISDGNESILYSAPDECKQADGTVQVQGCKYFADPEAGSANAFEAMTEIKDSAGRGTGDAAAHIYPEVRTAPHSPAVS